MQVRGCLALLLSLCVVGPASATQCDWPAWETYKQALVSPEGRVVDPSTEQRVTTSEGQSYGLFFALVANDRASFARLLSWTQDNLAGGDLSRRLSAWQWGRDPEGQWKVLDANNASDSDLWIAYSLLEAGRLWRQPAYEKLGLNMLWLNAAQNMRNVPGLGLMLLPGGQGFDSADSWRLNPSYLPPQLLARFTQVAPIWGELAANSQRLLMEGSPLGLAPDWLVWRAGQGWAADSVTGARGSYDAIRVYLWLGMLADDASGRRDLLEHFQPMLALITRLGAVPEMLDTRTGADTGRGPVGFSAALLPLLASAPASAEALKGQRERLSQEPPAPDAYYNRSLLLFGQGWDERRYRFDKNGRLLPNWVGVCKK
ncbi:cellulose synthase complex periplasmic endoglucanase BcsZ [Pseudomonas thivervalensis]|uniref:cellulase n=1 Tax=Pseudomonas thivervalensis TaxID=86265 RepID=A0A2Z5A166_9PSED|nr:cellulose synthase complex periplasmic endoglucanase BcsZ [Pseudomonas thivervalensis]AXA58383.1 endo-1,4-D-glucanase [Pseudomonas thivervalensis]AXA64094.1 endo-1,4-D-glucanase [Pseudomonas thivervalensis]